MIRFRAFFPRHKLELTDTLTSEETRPPSRYN